MKKTKLFAMISTILAMGLVACGPTAEPSKTPSSEEPPASTSAPAPDTSSTPAQDTSSTPAPSTSSTPAPSSSTGPSSSSTPAVDGQMAVNALDVIKESDKVLLKIGGTYSGYANADAMKMAFGLLDAIPAQGQTAQWLVGSATPADADYKYVPTIDATAGTFELKIDVTVVTEIKAGVYTIYVGAKGAYAAVEVSSITGMGTGKEILSGYRWYIRSDKAALAMDELPPIELTISRIEVEGDHVYHLIGGALNTAKLPKADFLAKHPYMQYEATTVGWKQNILGSSTKTDLVSVLVDEQDNALIKTDITSLPANGYNIKINLTEDKDADTKMDAIIDGRENPVPFGMYDYAVYADSTKNAKEDLYGNCGLFITESGRYVNNGDKFADLQPVKSKDGEIAYEMVAADCVGQNAPKYSDKNTRLGKNSKFTDVWEINGIRSGEYEVYVKGAYSSGNNNSYWSGALNVANGKDTETDGHNGDPYNPAARYNFKVDAGDAVDCICDKTYEDSGLTGAEGGGWTNVAMAKVMVPEGSATFTMTNVNNGYSLWIYALRLVRVGNWNRPVTPAAFDADGVMRIEAEAYHEASSDPAIKTDEEGTYLDHIGGWPQFNASYKINFTEAVNVKLKLRYNWYSQQWGNFGAAEFTLDGSSSKIKDASGKDNLAQDDAGPTNAWGFTESAVFELTAGDHTLKLQTPGGCVVSWNYFELIIVE